LRSLRLPHQTTPESNLLQGYFREMVERGVTHSIIEVTSFGGGARPSGGNGMPQGRASTPVLPGRIDAETACSRATVYIDW
jgi:hypothetical protein